MTDDPATASPASPTETAIFGLLHDRGPGKSICPTDAARAVDAETWRKVLPQVRATAVGLARSGRLEITRHGRPVDPESFKGVYRLRLPTPPTGHHGGGDQPAGEHAEDLEETPS